MAAEQDFELSDGDKRNPLWIRLKAHLEYRLDGQRRRNDSATLDPAQTAALRGHIQCLKGIISLGDDRPLTGDE